MVSRRDFLKLTGAAVSSTAFGPATAAASSEPREPAPDALGCLFDATLCVGCRRCEAACNEVNHLPDPARPFDDPGVLQDHRRTSVRAYTVVNRFEAAGSTRKFVNVKTQCMHCVDPSCVSACLVGAMRKHPNGAVTWDTGACIGCRYCMVACPFGVPKYEFDKGIEPRVMKCTLCYPRLEEGLPPACAAACPMEAIKFGPRQELLEVAHERLQRHPDRYVDQVYGEREVGGTSWLYIAPQPFETLGFLDLPESAPPRVTEAIQHGVFKHFAAPILIYAGLGALMARTARRREEEAAQGQEETAAEDESAS